MCVLQFIHTSINPHLCMTYLDGPILRALVQLLSNMITGNKAVAQALLPTYLRTPFDSNVFK